jgi:D-sedoheptulose 7-phosphate isomerase
VPNDATRNDVTINTTTASDVTGVTARWTGSFTRYLDLFDEARRTLDFDGIAAVVEVLRATRDRRSLLMLAGNGGSAATCTHLANDWSKAPRESGRTFLRVLSLSDNVSWFSALANDEGYDRVFAGQIENLASNGDTLVVISASGNSPNLVRAVEHAKVNGITTVGLLGFDGGSLLAMVDHPVLVATPKGEYGVVETAHVLIGDLITRCLIEDVPGRDGQP